MPRVCCNRVAPDHDLDTMSELVLMGHKCIGDGGTDFLEMSQATAVIELILEPYSRLVWTFKSSWVQFNHFARSIDVVLSPDFYGRRCLSQRASTEIQKGIIDSPCGVHFHPLLF